MGTMSGTAARALVAGLGAITLAIGARVAYTSYLSQKVWVMYSWRFVLPKPQRDSICLLRIHPHEGSFISASGWWPLE